MSLQIEYTDTFGGEANYCWVSRWFCKDDCTDAQAVRLAKVLTGLTGYRCRREDWGDTIALYPANMCRVIFVSYAEPGYENGKEVDRAGNYIKTCEELHA